MSAISEPALHVQATARDRMRPIFFAALLAIPSASCATSPQAEEPADLGAAGQSMRRLRALGWEVAPAITAADAESREGLAQSDDWKQFKSHLRPGDELRPVRHNAGIGYGIFRDGVLTHMFLVIIF